MKFIVAPDSFKGSISSQLLCERIEQGIRRVFPDATIVLAPLADGGEGTLDNLVASTNGKKIFANVCGPAKEKVKAAYGILGDKKTVVIEIAQASGLPLLTDKEKNPLLTTSYGTGELIKHALDEGFRHFIIGLGGSATNDAGTGMLKALGMKFFKENGKELEEGGGALADLAYYDDTYLDKRLTESSFVVASDVTNKLCGIDGASFVFGPQKGATPEMVEKLDAALSHYSDIVLKQSGINLKEFIGGGSAGGIGASLLAFCRGKRKSGIDVMLELIHFEKKLADATLVITGEGKLDKQTFSGKVISGVTRLAQRKNIPVIALCGHLELTQTEISKLGLLTAFSIVPGPTTLKEAIANTPEWVVERIESIMRVIQFNIEQ